MAKLIWAVLCQRILLDQDTQFLSYIDVVDGVALPSFPNVAPLILVGTLWQLEEAPPPLEVRIRLYTPDGSLLMESNPCAPEIKPEHKRMRIGIGLAGFPLASPGRYEFGVEQHVNGQWIEATRVPFDVEGVTVH